MVDEYSDILGNSSTPLRRRPESGISWTKLFITSLIAAFLYFLAQYLRSEYFKWREKTSRLSVRRKYGIPDSDHRPFNIAHADVLKARQRQGLMKQTQDTARMQRFAYDLEVRNRRPDDPLSVANRSSRLHDPSELRSSYLEPVGRTIATTIHSNRVTFADGFNASASPISLPAADLPSQSPLLARRKGLGILKVLRDDEELRTSDVETNSHSDVYVKRGSKRALAFEQDAGGESNMGASEKRARKGSLDNSTLDDLSQDEMDVDEDVVSEETSVSRGKKRDRTEADSILGGDEDQIEDGREKDKGRKRRNKRKSDAASTSRGKKRDRDSDQDENEVEAETDKAFKKKRKGRKSKSSLQDEEEKQSDISMSDSLSMRKHRDIGDIWESNGKRYKVGLDGQRLVEALVKKSRNRFSMPQDSVHPDRDLNFEVYVETWLTDAEYNDAKAQQLLAWQNSPSTVVKEDSSTTLPLVKASVPPVNGGKHLLWDSVRSPSPAVPSENPFDAPPKPVLRERRDSSDLRRSIMPRGLSDSTNSSPRQFRHYSTWEKQDLEAKAMMKVREANRKKEEERLAKEKAETASKPVIPSISVTRAESNTNIPKLSSASPAPFTTTVPSTKTDENKTVTPQVSSQPSTPSFPFPAPSQSSIATNQKPPAFSALPRSSGLDPPKPADKPKLGGLGAPPAPSIFSLSPSASPLQAPTTAINSQHADQTLTNKANSQPPPPALNSGADGPPLTNQPKFSFSFGGASKANSTPVSAQTVKDSTPSTTSEGGSNPLLARLGGFQSGSTTPKVDPPKHDPPKHDPPKHDPPKHDVNTQAAEVAASSGAPKFNFGFGKAPALSGTATPSAAPSASTSSNPSGTEPAKPKSTFSLKLTENKERSSTTPAPTPSVTGQPKFSFGTPASDVTKMTSPFGSTPPNTGQGAKQSPFAGGGTFNFGASSSSTNTGFGKPTTAFGSGISEISSKDVSSGVAGTTPSIFETQKPATSDSPANMFSSSGSNGGANSAFGQTGFGSTFSLNNTSDTPKPFGFGAPSSSSATKPLFSQASPFAASSASGGDSSKPTFSQTSSFGSSSSPFATPAKESGAPKPAFGQSSFGGTNVFGQASQSASSGSMTPATEPPKSVFGATAASGFTEGTFITTGSSTTPQNSPFGAANFGGSKPTFSFGSGSSSSTSNVFGQSSSNGNGQS